jgi:hypothetical protein
MEAPLAERIPKTRRLHKSRPSYRAQRIVDPTNRKGIIPSLILWDLREQEDNFTQIIARIKTSFLYFERYKLRSKGHPRRN